MVLPFYFLDQLRQVLCSIILRLSKDFLPCVLQRKRSYFFQPFAHLAFTLQDIVLLPAQAQFAGADLFFFSGKRRRLFFKQVLLVDNPRLMRLEFLPALFVLVLYVN